MSTIRSYECSLENDTPTVAPGRAVLDAIEKRMRCKFFRLRERSFEALQTGAETSTRRTMAMNTGGARNGYAVGVVKSKKCRLDCGSRLFETTPGGLLKINGGPGLT